MRLAFLGVVLVALPFTIAAQRVSLTPIAGVYVPLKVQATGSQGDVCGDPCPSTTWETKLAPGPAFGIKLALDWDASLGLEASLTHAVTAREHHATSTGSGPAPASGSAETSVAALRLTVTRPVFERAAVSLGAGFTLNVLSGSGYASGGEPLEDQSLLGLTLAGAFRTNVAPSAQLELGFASSFYAVSQLAHMSGQHDIIISAGLVWALGK